VPPAPETTPVNTTYTNDELGRFWSRRNVGDSSAMINARRAAWRGDDAGEVLIEFLLLFGSSWKMFAVNQYGVVDSHRHLDQ
jgi:hypothetical protein